MYKFLRIIIMLSILSALSACSYSTIEPLNVTASIDNCPTMIAIGYVKNANGFFYEGLKDGLGEISNIKVRTARSAKDYDPNAFMLKGDLKIIKRDNFEEKVSRHLVGFGLNRREVSGSFEVENSANDAVMSFTANEYYNGGTGLGGLLDVPGWLVSPFVEGIPYFTQTDIISTDTMQRRLGAEVGEQVREWILANMEQ